MPPWTPGKILIKYVKNYVWFFLGRKLEKKILSHDQEYGDGLVATDTNGSPIPCRYVWNHGSIRYDAWTPIFRVLVSAPLSPLRANAPNGV